MRAVLEQARDDQAILIPQKAVTRSASGVTTALLVVDGKVEQRELTLDRAIGNQWWVTSGLKAGDQLIVEGGQKFPCRRRRAVTDANAQVATPSTPVKEFDVAFLLIDRFSPGSSPS